MLCLYLSHITHAIEPLIRYMTTLQIYINAICSMDNIIKPFDIISTITDINIDGSMVNPIPHKIRILTYRRSILFSFIACLLSD